ncbi:MAG: alpha/beta hydrolase [Pseudomonadales bacterium]
MLAAPLPTVEVNPPTTPKAVVIWLHGLGADGHDFEPIVPQLKLPADLPIRFVFPHAPEMAVSLFAGGIVRAWFDISPNGERDYQGLKKSVLQIRDLIQTEIDNGISAQCIVLAGFSQGGALALRTALFYPKRLAGVLALSTFMAEGEDLYSNNSKTSANAKTPILMCHGLSDMVLPVAMGKSAYSSLKEADYAVEWREYPMGHEVCLAEIGEISRWLQTVLT